MSRLSGAVLFTRTEQTADSGERQSSHFLATFCFWYHSPLSTRLCPLPGVRHHPQRATLRACAAACDVARFLGRRTMGRYAPLPTCYLSPNLLRVHMHTTPLDGLSKASNQQCTSLVGTPSNPIPPCRGPARRLVAAGQRHCGSCQPRQSPLPAPARHAGPIRWQLRRGGDGTGACPVGVWIRH